MFHCLRLIAVTIVLLVFMTGDVSAQRRCPNCGKAKKHSTRLQSERQRRQAQQRSNRGHAPRQGRTAQSNGRVRRVQHTAELPPALPRFAQNPLDELQKELEGDDRPDDFLNELDDISDALKQEDSNDAESPSEGSSIDDILRSTDGDDDDDDSTNPLSVLDDDEDGEDPDEDEDKVDSTPGLRNDDYYRSLGAPREVRRRRGSQPLTMSNVLGDEEEYDCACQRAYCNSVWQCAGGRCQNWLGRIRRDLDRSNIVRNAACNGCRPYVNEFKCPKVQNNNNQGYSNGGQFSDAPYGDGQFIEGGYSDGYTDSGFTDGGYTDGYSGEVYDTGVIGDEYYGEPTPADFPTDLPTDIPTPVVDES